MKPFLFAAVAAIGLSAPMLADEPIQIVAAENFYGDIAAAIGGDLVKVTSVLNNPAQDPHLFEVSPSVARDIAAARIVISNGADYDPWIGKMLEANTSKARSVIVAADLVGSKAGANPHLWYDLATMPAVAAAVAAKLAEVDPAHKPAYEQRLATLNASLKAIADKVAAIKAKHGQQPATATEPVFGPMAAALGLVMRNEAFQLAVMNDTEPSARQVAAFEDDLKNRRVKVLFYNSQVTDAQAERLLALANKSGVPVVGVSETLPAGKTFVAWMLDQLDATEKALAGPSS